jgi:HEAT repeat protein
MACNHDIESLMNEKNYQGILDILKDEKLKNKMFFQVETSIKQIIDLVETDFIIKNLTGQNDKIKQAILYSLLEGNRNIENEENLIPLFLDFLNDKNSLLVAYSATLLGAVKEEIAIDSLIKLLNHRYFDARSSAALSLGRIGDLRAIEPLITRLYMEKDYDAEASIIDALKLFDNENANAELEKYFDSITPPHLKDVAKIFRAYDKSNPIELYTKYLKDENEEVCKYASECFYKIRDERAKDFLIEALSNTSIEEFSDTNQYTDYNIVRTLGHINTPDVIELLIERTKSKNDDIANNATYSIGEIYNKERENILLDIVYSEKTRISSTALYILGKNGFFNKQTNFDITVKIVRDIRSTDYAIMGLSDVYEKSNDKKVIEPLILALNSNSISNRELASEALGEIGEDAIEPLIKVLEDKNTFKNKKLLRATAKALCNIKSPKITDALIKMTSIKDVYVRVNACESLGKRKNSKSILALKICYYDDKHVKVQDAAKNSLRKLGIKELI